MNQDNTIEIPNNNKMITCVDCNNNFAFTEVDQEFFARMKYAQPKRCLSCRKARRANRENQTYEPGQTIQPFETFEG